jgi:hypothetical protein
MASKNDCGITNMSKIGEKRKITLMDFKCHGFNVFEKQFDKKQPWEWIAQNRMQEPHSGIVSKRLKNDKKNENNKGTMLMWFVFNLVTKIVQENICQILT